MTMLVLGSTGLLGQALMACAASRGVRAVGAARAGADHALDATDASSIGGVVRAVAPDLVVNCVALTDLNECERDPAAAWLVNARFAGLVAAAAPAARLVHVSTDHFYTGDGAAVHDEDAPVRLVNEYARSKYGAEGLALTHPDAVVVRTNVVGWRGWSGRPTFVEWAAGAIESGAAVSGFTDFHTSSIDARSLASAILDVAALRFRGVLNLASREVSSKFDFLCRLAVALGRGTGNIAAGSVRSLPVARAESAGLDVARAETLLGRRLPDLGEVVGNLIAQRTAACVS
jgi:dTDP-4-dehydrorhamnose reductase